MSKKHHHLKGKKFSKLKIVGFAMDGRHHLAKCICDCGARATIRITSILDGFTKSCGCIRRERISKMNYRHGYANRSNITPEWTAWHMIHQRCSNKNRRDWHRYGGRGIRVCRRWKTFSNFIADMGDKPFKSAQIDRKNNDGNYTPRNCRWATPKANSNNRGGRFKKL